MKIRYCQTKLQQIFPCEIGWAVYSAREGGSRNCHDEPMEKNCRKIIDTNTIRCPTCGQRWEDGK